METTPKPAEAPKPKSKTWMLIAIVVVILVVVGVTAYQFFNTGGGGPKGTQLTIYDGNPLCTNVSPPNCGFKDASGSNSTTITSGTSVYWTNSGGVTHTATSCDSTNAGKYGYTCSQANGSLPSFDTGYVAKGTSSSSITFNTAGTYYYFCSIHTWMHGTIVVK